MIQLEGAPVTVMGLGLFGGGVASTRWLVSQGAQVTVTDLRDEETLAPAIRELEGLDVRFVLGEHRAEDFEQAKMIVVNPAVPPASEWLQRATGEVVTEVELFLRTTEARLVLITGTHGKSSTTSLASQILTHAGLPARAGGNIGEPLLGADISADEVCVVELSSYQLEHFAEPIAPIAKVEAAALTCLAADHLERHGTIDAYAEAKARLGALCPAGSEFWLPADLNRDEFLHTGATVRRFGDGAELHLDGPLLQLEDVTLGQTTDLRVPGEFQAGNTLLAAALAHRAGATPESIAAAIPRLTGLPHRHEDLGLVQGRRVFDNGVSTTPDSTVAALVSIDGPCTLLVGGKAKQGLELDELIAEASARETRVIAFGDAALSLARAFNGGGIPVEQVATVEQACARALSLTPEGGTVLFSPACASFDAYPNFKARALAFRAALGL